MNQLDDHMDTMFRPRNAKDKEKVLRKTLNLFLILFLVLGGTMGGMVAVFYHSQFNTFLTNMKAREARIVEMRSRIIGDDFNSVVGDLLFLSRQNEMQELLTGRDPRAFPDMEQEFVQFLAMKKVYDQVRYLDEHGMEIVRVNDNAGHPAPVPRGELQNKADRYYFSQSFELHRGEVFISPMDLNIENGKIEQPLKPMIRIGTPVFDDTGAKRGVVVLNYLARTILDGIRTAESGDQGTPMLLDADGYWLLGPSPEDEWGFMYNDRADHSFSRAYPKVWERILSDGEGQLSTRDGLFTFRTVRPLDAEAGPLPTCVDGQKAAGYFWVLLSHIPSSIMSGYANSLRFNLFLLGAGLFILIALAAWSLALAITRRRIYQSQLITMALYDALTGLPNRQMFFERLDSGLDLARRHGHALGLLYIDLDGFKAVNDTHGHEAGDELLQHVARIMLANSRKSDVVARLGGDEFAIILPEIGSTGDAKTAAAKIIAALDEPIAIAAGTVSIGASIGAAVFPETSEDRDALLTLADQAMYQSKSRGKNTYTVAEPATEPAAEPAA